MPVSLGTVGDGQPVGLQDQQWRRLRCGLDLRFRRLQSRQVRRRLPFSELYQGRARRMQVCFWLLRPARRDALHAMPQRLDVCGRQRGLLLPVARHLEHYGEELRVSSRVQLERQQVYLPLNHLLAALPLPDLHAHQLPLWVRMRPQELAMFAGPQPEMRERERILRRLRRQLRKHASAGLCHVRHPQRHVQDVRLELALGQHVRGHARLLPHRLPLRLHGRQRQVLMEPRNGIFPQRRLFF